MRGATDREGAIGHRAWDALAGDAPHLAALRAMSIDLSMAAAVEGAEVVHSHTWYAQLAGHLAKLTYGVPHVATVHSLEPLRPWKAEQLGGGYALSSWCEKVSLESADARDRGLEGLARGHPRLLSGDRSRPRPGDLQRDRRRGVHARPRHRRAGEVRRRPGPAVGRVRRAHHAPEGRAVPGRRRAAVRRRRPARAVRGRAGHAGDRRRGRAEGGDSAARARQRDLARPDAAQARGDPAAQPRDGVRLPVDLRAAGHRQPRGDGLRGSGGGDRHRRDRRGRGRRRDRPAGAVRAGGGRHRPARSGGLRRTGSPSASTRWWPIPTRARAMGRAGRERAVREFDWSAIARETSELYRSLA